MPRGLCRCLGPFHRRDCPSGRPVPGRRHGVAVRDLGHRPRQHRLRIPARASAPVLVLPFLHTLPRRSTLLAPPLGRPRRTHAGRPHGAFPSQHALGVHCVDAYHAMYNWAQNSAAIFPTIGFGYISWFFLLVGVVAVLRASGRGRTGWEIFGVTFLALTPIVWAPLLDFYHPQDLVCVGLALAGTACALRGKWIWAGVLVGLAVTSQQFGLLVLAPLFVLAPGKERWKMLGSSAGAVVILSLPFIAATSGRAIHAVILGTGNSFTQGGTVLWETTLRGAPLTFFSRVVPILVAMALAWWAGGVSGPQPWNRSRWSRSSPRH